MIIDIQRYSLPVKLGHFDFEHLALQDLKVSLLIQVGYCTSNVEERDNLHTTVDYGAVLTLMQQNFAGRQFRLIERIVCELGQCLMDAFPQIEAVKVTVEKTRLPKRITRDARIHVYRIFLRSNEVVPCW